MYRLIFRYRLAALLFALATIAGVVRLVGTGKEDGELAQLQRRLIDQRSQYEQATQPEVLPFPPSTSGDANAAIDPPADDRIAPDPPSDDGTASDDPDAQPQPGDEQPSVELVSPEGDTPS